MNRTLGLVADANAALAVGDRDHLAQHRRAVIAPAEIGDLGAAEERDARWQVLMRAVPGALDIADGDALALRARQPPNIRGADAIGGGIEIALRRLEEPRAGRLAIDAGRFRARRDIGLPHRLIAVERIGELLRVGALLGHDLHEATLLELGVRALGIQYLGRWIRGKLGRQIDPLARLREAHAELRADSNDVEVLQGLVQARGIIRGRRGRGEAGGGDRDRLFVSQLRHDVVRNIRGFERSRRKALPRARFLVFSRHGRRLVRCAPHFYSASPLANGAYGGIYHASSRRAIR